MNPPDDLVDLLVIGGGINGAGIARDAAGRGLRVMLVEQSDLASATSSASSKLIHGGLRYLEQYEFRLVREALGEREVLLSLAPHIIWPLTFVLPHDASLRPTWMIRAGLFLYDHLSRRKRLPPSRYCDLTRDPVGVPLKRDYTRGFSYSDCWVEDSRLVVLNALDAAERGAVIHTRCKFLSAEPHDGTWSASLEADGLRRTVRARILVNAAGPWVEGVLRNVITQPGPAHLRLVKGSHIVVPRLYEGEQAYILQNPDKRIVFVIPYERNFTLIGTTDLVFDGDPGSIKISDEETAYICRSASRFLAKAVEPGQVVWSYSGVRPLYDDDSRSSASTVTRDYTFDVQGAAGQPPVLSIYGGKITTYRRLAEHAMEKLSPFLPDLKPAWTGSAPLPGGDMPDGDFDAFLAGIRQRWSWLPGNLVHRLARAYGTRMTRIIGDARSLADLGEDLGAGLTAREVAYLVETEWAQSVDDILWRRSKLGLHGGGALAERLRSHLRTRKAWSGDAARPCAPPVPLAGPKPAPLTANA